MIGATSLFLALTIMSHKQNTIPRQVIRTAHVCRFMSLSLMGQLCTELNEVYDVAQTLGRVCIE